MQNNSQIEIYKTLDGEFDIKVRMDEDTVWLNQEQMVKLFCRDKSVISKHIGNVYKERELLKESTVAKFAIVEMEGNREVVREIEHYNLDVIISNDQPCAEFNSLKKSLYV